MYLLGNYSCPTQRRRLKRQALKLGPESHQSKIYFYLDKLFIDFSFLEQIRPQSMGTMPVKKFFLPYDFKENYAFQIWLQLNQF